MRDRIPEIMRADGREPDVRVMDDQEYLASLFDKLLEEAEELRQAPPEQRMEEAADVYEVLLAIAASLGSDIEQVRARADQKRHDRGGFSTRIWWSAGEPAGQVGPARVTTPHLGLGSV